MKVGWAKDPMQRAIDGWWENSHPKELCGKLCPLHYELLGLWEGTQEEEKALHEQWNEGILSRKDCHNEFYEVSEWPKISRELCNRLSPAVWKGEDSEALLRWAAVLLQALSQNI